LYLNAVNSHGQAEPGGLQNTGSGDLTGEVTGGLADDPDDLTGDIT